MPIDQHYPKLSKYISLFPPELRQKAGGNAKGKGREVLNEQDEKKKAATDLQREEIRLQIRQQMESGQLSNEPELELEDHAARTMKRSALGAETVTSAGKAAQNAGKKKDDAGKSSKPKRVPEIQDDDFFGEESEESEEEEAAGSGSGEEDGMDED